MLKFFIIFLLITGCVQQTPTGLRESKQTGDTDGSGAGPGNGGISSSGGDPVAKVEIRHFVDPVDGTYKRKLTLPKNYNGKLYLSGLNFTTLRSKHLYVRFKFGMLREPIVLEATLGRGQGITPATEIDVLIMDMAAVPFDDIRLLYDLYDYNTYDFSGGDTPVTSNRDSNLFCRGLYLEDDSTFTGTGTCSSSSSECKYAYAKVLDRGLMKDDGSGSYYSIVPSQLRPQIDIDGIGYTKDSTSNSLTKCLRDDPTLYGTFHDVYDYDSSTNTTTTYPFLAVGVAGVQSINGTNYYYNGPYRPANSNIWQISGDAIFGTYGLFSGSLNASDPTTGYGSKLFPLYGKMDLSSGTQHLSASTPNSAKTLVTTFPTSGETEWMDGCNIRVSSLNTVTNEHIGSCNVTATVEILEKDTSTGEFSVIAGTDDGGKEVKLQLVRSSVINDAGDEILFSALNQCTSSSSCGANECCFNNRCWSKELVSQCSEEVDSTGDLPLGSSCSSDFNCSSLCCNAGTCSVHNNTLEPAVLCNKPSGNFCIAKEWCAKQTVQECYIVKTGTNNVGDTTCEVRCYNVEQFGDCKSGVCVPPITPDVPVFNPSDPNACDEAIDPPY